MGGYTEHKLDGVNKDINTEFPDAKSYLDLVSDWVSAYPIPKVIEHEGFNVIREDLLEVGTKARALDYRMANMTQSECVYVQPRYGYAGIALSWLANKHGKKCVLFVPESKGITPHIQRCFDYGAEIHFRKIYGMNGLRKYAREYCEANTDSYYFQPGLRDEPTITACLIKTAISMNIKPKEVWSVVSTGVLQRALQIAWPDADFHAVAVARNMKPGELGKANIYSHPMAFSQCEKDIHLPPFPSAPNYDAKAWRFVREHASLGAYFWNVAGY
jgi:hypothetical protein